MIHGVHHTAISTGQLDRMVDFYGGFLGFELISKGGWEAGNEEIDALVGLPNSAARTAMLRSGTVFLEMFEYSSPPAQPSSPDRPVCDHGYTHICLAVTDIDSEFERLRQGGMRFHAAPTPAPQPGDKVRRSSIRSAYGRDPDGNVVELLELLHPESPLHLAATTTPAAS